MKRKTLTELTILTMVFVVFLSMFLIISNKINKTMNSEKIVKEQFYSSDNNAKYFVEGNTYIKDLSIAIDAGYIPEEFNPQYDPFVEYVSLNGFETSRYYDKYGVQISAGEYERRKSTLDKDKAAYKKRQQMKLDNWKSEPNNLKAFEESKKRKLEYQNIKKQIILMTKPIIKNWIVKQNMKKQKIA